MRRATRGLGAVLVLWAAAVAIVRPTGDFPLMDDWMFAYGVDAVVNTGGLALSSNMEPSGVVHILWGALFAAAGGATYEVLRVSVLVLAAATVAVVWLLARRMGADETGAALAAAVFAFNPIALELGATFMSDVPFALWSTLSCVCFLRQLEHPGWRSITGAAAFTTLATLTRQVGLVWAIAFVPIALTVWRPWSLRRVAVALAPLAVGASALWWYSHWRIAAGQVPSGRGLKLDLLMELAMLGIHQPWNTFAKNSLNIAFHFGWYVLPVVIWSAGACDQSRWRRWLWLPLSAAAIVLSGKTAPWGSTILSDLGVGATGERRHELTSLGGGAHAPHWVWVAWTVAALCASAAFAIRLARWGVERALSPRQQFLIAGIALHLVPLVLTGFYDRYLLAVLPAAAALCAAGVLPQMRVPFFSRVGWGLVAVYAVFGAVAAHDYFSFSRARWTAIAELRASGRYQPEEIDGGFEYAGLIGRHVTGQPDLFELGRVIVARRPLAGVPVCGQIAYRAWLLPRWDAVWVMAVPPEPCPALSGTDIPEGGGLETLRVRPDMPR